MLGMTISPAYAITVGEATCLPPKRYVPNKREDDILPYEKMKSLAQISYCSRGFHTQLRCDSIQRFALILRQGIKKPTTPCKATIRTLTQQGGVLIMLAQLPTSVKIRPTVRSH